MPHASFGPSSGSARPTIGEKQGRGTIQEAVNPFYSGRSHCSRFRKRSTRSRHCGPRHVD